jgi:hypothetical protein
MTKGIHYLPDTLIRKTVTIVDPIQVVSVPHDQK